MFAYHAEALWCESVPLATLAQTHGTPLYVYSANAVRGNYRRLAAAFAPLRPQICYAVKANFNLSLLRLLKEEGAGFDIVSGGELHRALTIGADPAHIVFAGVGKTDAELVAALDAQIGWFNVESADEWRRLNALALARGQTATVALRLNPAVDADTHQHIATGGARNKFGLPLEEALALAQRAEEFPALRLRGVHIHIGSQLPNANATLQALDIALQFVAAVPSVDCLDLGGGFPAAYRDTDEYASVEDFAAPIMQRLLPYVGRLSFHLEPGRFLVANAGVLLTTVQAVKDIAGRRTYVVDAGMNALLRPALYDAYHRLLPVLPSSSILLPSDIVGPICESADVLARDRDLPTLNSGALLAVMDVGAYGFSMASNYNAHPRPAEVLVEGETARVVRRRETLADLVALEA
jgi:diaminopimelate decarboxylase